MNQTPVEVLNESEVLLATEKQDDCTVMIGLSGDWSVIDQLTETGANNDVTDLAMEGADSAEVAEDLVGDMGTDTEEAEDTIGIDDSVTRVGSSEQDTDSKSIADYLTATLTDTPTHGKLSEETLAASPNKKGQISLITEPTECTSVKIEIDLNEEYGDFVAQLNADQQAASGSCSTATMDKSSTGDLTKSNTAEMLQAKTGTDNASCEQEMQTEDIPTDESKQIADKNKNLPQKQVPDIQKIESSDIDSFASRSVESTDEDYMEISDANLPDKQTQYAKTDGDAVVLDEYSDVIEIADSPPKPAVTIEFQSVKGGALKVAASARPQASKPEIVYDRGFATPIPKSLSKLKQLTVNIGPIRLIDLHCKKLYNILKINPTFEIKFEPKEKTLDNGIKVVDSCGYVRLPFEITFPSILVKISDKLSDLNINGRDMSVKFPEAFNKAVQECKAWVQKRNEYTNSGALEVKQRRVMIQQMPKKETSGEKLKSLFPHVDKIIMLIGKDYDDTDICLAVFLEFKTVAALEKFLNTGSSNISLDGRLLHFHRIAKVGVKPHPVPGQVGNTTPGRKNSPATNSSQLGASSSGTSLQKGRGKGLKGRGGRGLRGRAGPVGGVRGRARGKAITTRSTLHRGHYSPGGGQFKDLHSPHGQFEADFRTRKHDKFSRTQFEPQRDAWIHGPHDDRRQKEDRWRSPSRFEHNKQRRSASESDETRAMLEAMKSKLENMERKLANKGGSILPSIDVNKDPFPEKKRGQGVRGQPAGRKWGRGRGAGQPFQQSKQQGYESKQQGYESKQQGFQSKQQGYESKQQGYKSPRQHSPGQRFKQEQPQVSTKPSNQTFHWSGSNDQDLLPDRQWGQPALGKFEPSWSYDHGLVAGEPRAASGQGQLGRGSGGAGRDGGYRGRGKARNKSGGKRKADNFTLDYQQASPKRQYSEGNFKDDSVQYSAVDRWQQERYPNMQYDQTLSQGDGGQGREHTYPPSPYQDQGFAAPNTSYYQQY